MPPPYDTVISIGGQSLVDGVWRLLGPALAGLSNPLPLTIPGFTNAEMRISRIIPVFPGTPPTSGALDVLATVELTAEALLNVSVSAGDITITLGPQDLHLTNLTGTIGLPDQNGDLTNIRISGTYPAPIGTVNLGPGTGSVHLPANTATLTNGDLTGTINLPHDLTIPGIPFPAVVPIAVDLTPSTPLLLAAALSLRATGVNATTRFGLLIDVTEVSLGPITLSPGLVASVTSQIRDAVSHLVDQLHIPVSIVQGLLDPPTLAATVTTLLAPVQNAVRSAFTDALTVLLGETGRLVYPPAGTGASCDVTVLPTAADAQLVVGADNTYVLQLGFSGPGSTDIPAFPTFLPMGLADTSLTIGNAFLLQLLCCLVERLPAFTFPLAAVTTTIDINGASHLMCCNFTNVTVDLGPIALGSTASDGISVCIDGMSGSSKMISIIGHFFQSTAVANITVDFTLPLSVDLNDLAALANLRVLGAPTITVSVTPSAGLIVALGVVGLLLIGPAVGATAITLLIVACLLASSLLNNSVRTILREASLVKSPVAVPPGVFEAFGSLVPVTVSIDDLTAASVLQTPTAPWALLPRIGLGRTRGGQGTNPTHG
jgi:hypothetical protein